MLLICSLFATKDCHSEQTNSLLLKQICRAIEFKYVFEGGDVMASWEISKNSLSKQAGIWPGFGKDISAKI